MDAGHRISFKEIAISVDMDGPSSGILRWLALITYLLYARVVLSPIALCTGTVIYRDSFSNTHFITCISY